MVWIVKTQVKALCVSIRWVTGGERQNFSFECETEKVRIVLVCQRGREGKGQMASAIVVLTPA